MTLLLSISSWFAAYCGPRTLSSSMEAALVPSTGMTFPSIFLAWLHACHEVFPETQKRDVHRLDVRVLDCVLCVLKLIHDLAFVLSLLKLHCIAWHGGIVYLLTVCLQCWAGPSLLWRVLFAQLQVRRLCYGFALAQAQRRKHRPREVERSRGRERQTDRHAQTYTQTYRHIHTLALLISRALFPLLANCSSHYTLPVRACLCARSCAVGWSRACASVPDPHAAAGHCQNRAHWRRSGGRLAPD